MAVRKPAVAGTFYSDDERSLQREIAKLAVSERRDAKAVIAPHAGYGYSGETANLAISSLPASTRCAIVIGPTHYVPFDGISVGAYSSYQTPLGCCLVEQDVCEQLLANCPQAVFRSEVHQPEHSVEVELPLLQTHCPDTAIVPIVVGRLSLSECESVARRLLPWVERQDTVVVVSTDMTHYGPRFGYVPFTERVAPEALRKMDLTSIDHMLSGDLEAFDAWRHESGTTICGWLPVLIFSYLRRMLAGPLTGELLRYTNSGEISGSFVNAVGYAGLAYAPASAREAQPTEADRRALLRFAREVISARIAGELPPPEPEGLSAVCGRQAGGFVSLHRHGQLCGCIGTIEAVSPVVETVRRNAEAAAFRDPRFPELQQDELADLEIEISLLSEPRAICEPSAFQVGRHGVILEVSNRRAVFLPQVAPEQGWDRVQTLRHLARKAGLSDDAWRRPEAELSVFTALVFGDADT
jgi:AmmeMemoRadiSam system protein B/AmmeMemoRadiSam system protein A